MNLTAIGISTEDELVVWSAPFDDRGELEMNRAAAEAALRGNVIGCVPERILIMRNNVVDDDFNVDN